MTRELARVGGFWKFPRHIIRVRAWRGHHLLNRLLCFLGRHTLVAKVRGWEYKHCECRRVGAYVKRGNGHMLVDNWQLRK